MDTLLETGKLYILSGLPGAGKDYFLQDIPREMIISPDQIRETFFPVNLGREGLERFEGANPAVFGALYAILEARMKEKLTTFINAVNHKDDLRKAYVKLAKKYGVDYEVIIFDDIEGAIRRNEGRKDFKVPEEVIAKLKEEFEETSSFPFRTVPFKAVARLVPSYEIPEETKLDAIGDIHGVYDDFLRIITEMGYDGSGNHPQGRKIILLGDFIDRGPDSVKMIDKAMQLDAHGHYIVIGNHEAKLIANLKKVFKGEKPTGSPGVLQTLSSLLREKNEEEVRAIYEWLIRLKPFYTWKDFIFTHAPLYSADPMNLPASFAIYGQEPFRPGVDERFEHHVKTLKRSHPHLVRYRLVHGHIDGPEDLGSVISLDGGGVYGRKYKALRMDEVEDTDFTTGLLEFDSSFNYSNVKKNRAGYFTHLQKQKLVVSQHHPSGLLEIFKYSKKVFYNSLWDESKRLLEARGIVLDFAGNIVTHPFDKVFNYLERGTGKEIPDDQNVMAVEKLNGFLGNFSFNPFDGSPLFTTSGSFTGDFVDLFKREFRKASDTGKVLRFIKENNLTLSFEVVVEEDPHIVPYGEGYEADYGIYLIGARKNEWDAPQLSEAELDKIAEEFGYMRPRRFIVPFGQIVEFAKKVKELEGWMIRDLDSGEILLKIKTAYYLTGKTLRNLSPKKIEMLYSIDRLEKGFDEDIVPALKKLRTEIGKQEFVRMKKSERLQAIHRILTSENP